MIDYIKSTLRIPSVIFTYLREQCTHVLWCMELLTTGEIDAHDYRHQLRILVEKLLGKCIRLDRRNPRNTQDIACGKTVATSISQDSGTQSVPVQKSIQTTAASVFDVIQRFGSMSREHPLDQSLITSLCPPVAPDT